MSVQGIDISNANGSINWQKVRASGKHFVFFKVNEGDFIDHTTTEARVTAAHRTGMLVGGYDFLRPKTGRTGAQEFDIFWKHAKAVGLTKKGCLRPVLDIEATGFKAFKQTRTRRYVKSWVDRCVQVTGKHPIIYTGYFWRETLGDWNTTLGCNLWLAAYTTNWKHYIPKAWNGHASFHQYSETGKVPGVNTKVDLNEYLATIENLKRSHTL